MASHRVLLAMCLTVQVAALTTTAAPGQCSSPSLAASSDVSKCVGFPPVTCKVECASGFVGTGVTYECKSAEEGFVGKEPDCSDAKAETTTTPPTPPTTTTPPTPPTPPTPTPPTPSPTDPTPSPVPTPTAAPKRTINMQVTLTGVDFDTLMANEEHKTMLVEGTISAVVSGTNIPRSDVTVTFSSGSVIMDIAIKVAADELQSKMATLDAVKEGYTAILVKIAKQIYPDLTITATVSALVVPTLAPTPSPPTPPVPTPATVELDSFAQVPRAHILVIAVLASLGFAV